MRQFQAEAEKGQKLRQLDASELRTYQPLLREGYAAGGLIDPISSDINADALHRGFLKKMKQHGGELIRNMPIQTLHRQNELWHVHSKDQHIKAKTVINACYN